MGSTHRNGLDPSGASLVGRVFAILDAFGPADDVVSLSELSRRTRLPKSTVHRITTSLVQRRALSKSPAGFQLGMRLFELGGLVPVQSTIREAALPFMEDLYEATHETVHLGVLDGTDVVYIEKLAGHRRVRVPSRVGGRMPAHCVGLGKAMLAFADPPAVERVLATGLPRRTAYTVTMATQFLEVLASVRRAGVAYDREEALLGVCCAAAPVLDRDRRPVAALSVTGPTTRLDPERYAPAVRTAAAMLSRTLASRAVVLT